jgi:hypothetical protein
MSQIRPVELLIWNSVCPSDGSIHSSGSLARFFHTQWPPQFSGPGVENCRDGFCCTWLFAGVASTAIQMSREHLPKRDGTPYWPFFSFWISSIPAITILAFSKDLKAEHGSDAELHAAMVLLHYVVQVFAASDLDRVVPAIVEFVPHPHSPERRMTGLKAIERDGARFAMTF